MENRADSEGRCISHDSKGFIRIETEHPTKNTAELSSKLRVSCDCIVVSHPKNLLPVSREQRDEIRNNVDDVEHFFRDRPLPPRKPAFRENVDKPCVRLAPVLTPESLNIFIHYDGDYNPSEQIIEVRESSGQSTSNWPVTE